MTKTLATGFIQAFTLGNILVFGVILTNIATSFGSVTNTTDLAFYASMQYALFLLTGFLTFFGKSLLGNKSKAEIILSCIGVFFWIIGYAVPAIAAQNNLPAFIGVWLSFGGVGAGMLYWNTLSMVPTWWKTDQARTLALGWVSISPSLYTIIFPYIFQALSILTIVNFSTWAFTYLLFVVAFVLMWFMVTGCCFYTTGIISSTDPSKEDKQDEVDEPDPLSTVYSKSSFFLFLLGCMLLQSSFYIPYVRLPAYVLESMNRTTADKDVAGSMIGYGSLTGRIVFTILAYMIGPRWQFVLISFCSAAMSLFYLLWAFPPNFEAILSFAFFFGFFSGGCYVCSPLILNFFWKKVQWSKNIIAYKLGWWGFALCIGEIFSACLIRFAVSTYASSILFGGITSALASIVFIATTAIHWRGESARSDQNQPTVNYIMYAPLVSPQQTNRYTSRVYGEREEPEDPETDMM
jgi:MFS family permease